MPVPKRKTSKSKRNMRRAQQKINEITLSKCPSCGEPKKPHHMCLACGTYKGRTIIQKDDD